MPTTISKVCDKIILVSFYLLFIIVPLILTPVNYELFEYNKMMTVYALTVVISAAWLIKSISLGGFKIRRTPFDWALILFLISQIFSTVFSLDTHISFWGYYSRFHGGLLSTISYTVLFYALVSNLSNPSASLGTGLSNLGNLKKFLGVILAAGILVSFYGILEHFGIDKNLWVQDVENRVFSTLGQPNWLAAYLAVLIPITLGLSLINADKNADKRGTGVNQHQYQHPSAIKIFFSRRTLFLIFSLVFYLTLLYTKSRSGIYAFWISDIVFWLFVILGRSESDDSRIKTKIDSGQARMTVKNIGRLEGVLGRHLKLFLISNLFFLLLTFVVGGSGLGPLEKFSLPALTQRFSQTAQTTPTAPIPTGQSALETGITDSGAIREIVWKGAWDIFLHNPILGTGVETFAFAYYQYRPAAHNMTSEWDFLYNKAHNEFLNFLATTGIFGFGSWMFFILSFIWWSIKNLFSRFVIPAQAGIHKNLFFEPLDFSRDKLREKFSLRSNNNHIDSRLPACRQAWHGNDKILLVALFSGWLSILITDFFGFSVVIIALLFFLIPAVSFLLAQKEEKNLLTLPLKISSLVIKVIIFIIIIIAIYLEFSLFQMWRADTFFALGYRYNRSGQFTAAYENLVQAIKINPNEPFYHDEFSYTLSTLALAAKQQKEATLSSYLTDQTIAQSDYAINEEPNNLNYYKTRTRVFYALAEIDPKYNNGALSAIEKAAELAPTDPKIHYNLAILYGRAGETQKALDILKETVKLKPDYRDPYYALALLEKDLGQTEAAKTNLEFILKHLNPNDQEAKQKLEEWNK
ncbi:MAG: O-antigen ligase family protein [Patescibacteria group bacterium]|nr:O-antigen ligase family protein [Patescibacteria group bacterium]